MRVKVAEALGPYPNLTKLAEQLHNQTNDPNPEVRRKAEQLLKELRIVGTRAKFRSGRQAA